MIRRGAAQIAIAENAFASPFVFHKVRNIENAFAHPFLYTKSHFTIDGALYDAEGRKLSLSERWPGEKGDRVISTAADQIVPPASAKFLPGRSLYLGHLMASHYGHFLLETLSTFWSIPDLGPIDTFVFHPFIFGRDIPEYARFIFDAFGLEASQIHIVSEPTCFEHIIVPERLVRLNNSIHEKMRAVYQRITCLADTSPVPRLVYLSRTKVRERNKRISNEDEVEAVFRSIGFEIIHPQELPISSQLAIYSRAKVIAGCTGSQMHNIVFSGPSTCYLIVLDARHPERVGSSQRLCNIVSNARHKVIRFRGDRQERRADSDSILTAINSKEITSVISDGSRT